MTELENRKSLLVSAYEHRYYLNHPTIQEYVAEHAEHPSHLSTKTSYHNKMLMEYLNEKYKNLTETFEAFEETSYDGGENISLLKNHQVIKLKKDLWITMYNDFFVEGIFKLTKKPCKEKNLLASHINIFYNKKHSEEVQKIYDDIKVISIYENPKKLNHINLVVKNPDLALSSFEIKKTDINFDLMYNEGFENINNIVVERLNQEKSKGIIIFHGSPGTGKTSYIRFLLSKLNKRVIYIPPNLTNIISDPSFLTFLTQIQDSILVIEDAENIIKDRNDADMSNQAVSNILNLTDGILSDVLNIQVICTFNTSIDNIDKALLRPGRLICEYEFKSLSVDRARKLAESIGIDGVEIEKDMPICDIFNLKNTNFYSDSKNKKKKKIGF